MPGHSKLWYLEQLHLLDGLTDAQKHAVEKMARMTDYQIAKRIGLRMHRLHVRVEDLLHKSALARVAPVLLGLAADHGVRDRDGIVIPLHLSQGDLANLVGLARETVNVTLRELKGLGLVEMDRSRIRLRDPARLRGVT